MRSIVIQGASEHNLKNISLTLPRDALTVFTGVSGSGKSSLAHDTIYREGQRRFLESLSAYARQYLGSMDRPRVERIEGLSPTVSIDQKTVGRSPRSTVGTITEIYDHLRLLYARLGTPHCPRCGREIESQSAARIADRLLSEQAGKSLLICAPVVRRRKGEYRKKLEELLARGHPRLRIDGRLVRLDREGIPELPRYQHHTIEIVHDRLTALPEHRARLTDSVERCLELAGGVVSVLDASREEERAEPPAGRRAVKARRVPGAAAEGEWLFSSQFACPDCGVSLPEVEPRLFSFNSPHGACAECHGLGVLTLSPDLTPAAAREPCPACGGSRLRPEARSVRFAGRTITELAALPAGDLLRFVSGLQLEGARRTVGRPILKEISARLGFLREVGLEYLSLDRAAPTLAGGEAQRIRLAGQVGAALQGVLFVLDEPSIGLHPRDNRRLLGTLRRLLDNGNTVLVVEHDRETIETADHLVDIGPGAGREGGEVVAEGLPGDLARVEKSITGQYLSGARVIPLPAKRRPPGGRRLSIRGARHHNLKGLDVDIPLGLLVVLTGVSGSGKSSLVHGVLRPALEAEILRRTAPRWKAGPLPLESLAGADEIEELVEIDQSPIGRSPRSNPATYTKLFTLIRDLYASLPEARVRGYGPERFSFNRDSGRCLQCRGAGVIQIEMQFLAPVEIVCEDCGGRRYNRETLEITYRGRSIAQVLAMPVREALEFFQDHPRIRRILEVMDRVGLGYVDLGQPSTTLSGGEAQRVKLASELHRARSGGTLYLLDEPTTGLHFEDVRTLLAALQGLVEQGSSVLVIEHNPEVMKAADWIIDLGPEGGQGGGEVVAVGPPEEIARSPRSHTGKVLARELSPVPPVLPTSPAAGPAGGGGREPPALVVRGASQHNLKSVDVTIPRGSLTVITGVSGSGKSSLAFDTIFTEGQRRYLESLSTYARRFLGRMESAPVDRIEGLAPSIAIDQKSAPRNPRSTVATMTEIYDHLRLLYARIGVPYCPNCDLPLAWTTPTRLAQEAVERHGGKRGYLLAPLSAAEAGAAGSRRDRDAARAVLVKEGFTRLLVGGREVRLDEDDTPLAVPSPSVPGGRFPKGTVPSPLGPPKGKFEKDAGPSVPAADGAAAGDGEGAVPDPEIHLVVDRVLFGEEARTRIAGSLETAFERGRGRAAIQLVDSPVEIYSREPACPACGFRFSQELSPRMFSFSSHLGACPRCSGLGTEPRVVPQLLVMSREKPLLDFALWPEVHYWLTRPGSEELPVLEAMARARKIDLGKPFGKLSAEERQAVLEGTGTETYPAAVNQTPGRAEGGRGRRSAARVERTWPGLAAAVEEWYRRVRDSMKPGFLDRVLRQRTCSHCGGGRLRPEFLRVRIGGGRGNGKPGLGIAEVTQLTVGCAARFFAGLSLDGRAAKIGEQVLREIQNRLRFLIEVGLEYLTLDRSASTLSGGEAQRIRLASQIGNRLVGVLYVLDEPTVGLHPRDTARLLDSLRELRDLGNTVIVVEHDRESIQCADQVIDMGPGAGALGGTVVESGTPEEIRRSARSLTGRYLRGELAVAPEREPRSPRRGEGGEVEAVWLRGVRRHNLKGVDAEFPLGLLTVVSGVSGSGKSSLVVDALGGGLRRALAAAEEKRLPAGERPRRPGRPAKKRAPRAKKRSPALDDLGGAETVRRLVLIDQSPIGQSPRSNPATYTGLWNEVRALYAVIPEARMRGYGPERFSFNLPGGRCEACSGEGAIRVEMHFLSDVWIPCEECGGNRFNRGTLEIGFKGLHVGQVLELEAERAREVFADHPRVRAVLDVLCDVGLGYLKLGQSATTLSGGEAQRVKLAAELISRAGGGTFYILDEPTTGLHFDDVRKLLLVLHRLVDAGNTMVVIEHNVDVIRSADWVIDLGPEGGDAGGRIVAAGRPEDIARAPESHTGRFLAKTGDRRPG